MSNMAPLFTSKPKVGPGLTSYEAAGVIEFLTKYFHVRRPMLKFKRRCHRGRYRVQTATIVVGYSGWRGVHTVVHEFAHHLDLTRRGYAGKFMPRPRVRGTLITVMGTVQTTVATRREFHGPSFTRALEDCARAIFSDPNMYSWETEYKTVQREHERGPAYAWAGAEAAGPAPAPQKAAQPSVDPAKRAKLLETLARARAARAKQLEIERWQRNQCPGRTV